MNYPDSLKVLIDSFKKLPSIGEKTAERLFFEGNCRCKIKNKKMLYLW